MEDEKTRYDSLSNIRTNHGGPYFEDWVCKKLSAASFFINDGKQFECAFCTYKSEAVGYPQPYPEKVIVVHEHWQDGRNICPTLTGLINESGIRNLPDVRNEYNWTLRPTQESHQLMNDVVPEAGGDAVIYLNNQEATKIFLRYWDLPVIVRALSGGLIPEKVRNALFFQIKNCKPMFKYVAEIRRAIIDMESREAADEQREIVPQRNRSRQIINALTCKVCLTAAVENVFLPCTHTVCCLVCRAQLTECPICRTVITGTLPFDL